MYTVYWTNKYYTRENELYVIKLQNNVVFGVFFVHVMAVCFDVRIMI